MNAVPCSRDFPALPLVRSCVEKSRIPCKRHGDRSAIGEVDAEYITRNADISDTRISDRGGSGHSTPPLDDDRSAPYRQLPLQARLRRFRIGAREILEHAGAMRLRHAKRLFQRRRRFHFWEAAFAARGPWLLRASLRRSSSWNARSLSPRSDEISDGVSSCPAEKTRFFFGEGVEPVSENVAPELFRSAMFIPKDIQGFGRDRQLTRPVSARQGDGPVTRPHRPHRHHPDRGRRPQPAGLPLGTVRQTPEVPLARGR